MRSMEEIEKDLSLAEVEFESVNTLYREVKDRNDEALERVQHLKYELRILNKLLEDGKSQEEIVNWKFF